MGKRREGREAALQFLYQLDLSDQPPAELFADFWKLRANPGQQQTPTKTRVFAEQLASGVFAHRAAIDEQIVKYAANYSLERIAAVDRNILRMGIYEMLFCPDVPPVVSINEAIEIAKKFGSEESGRFINGILDRVRGELSRSPRQAEPLA